MNILVIDVGGTNIKFLATGQEQVVKVPSGPDMTAEEMVRAVRAATRDWDYEVVSIGYPGPVADGRPLREPFNLSKGWMDLDYQERFGRPVKLVNDAAMQALGSYQGGRMLFLGLGTGLGSALVIGKTVVPLELAHLPYRKGRTFEDYLGLRGIEQFGKRKWRRAVADVVARLKAAMVADYVVLGGGNAKRIRRLPADTRRGDNRNAFVGGFRLWETDVSIASPSHPSYSPPPPLPPAEDAMSAGSIVPAAGEPVGAHS
ncbi:MAG: ROK family protein [Pirellulales bacterium]